MYFLSDLRSVRAEVLQVSFLCFKIKVHSRVCMDVRGCFMMHAYASMFL